MRGAFGAVHVRAGESTPSQRAEGSAYRGRASAHRQERPVIGERFRGSLHDPKAGFSDQTHARFCGSTACRERTVPSLSLRIPNARLGPPSTNAAVHNGAYRRSERAPPRVAGMAEAADRTSARAADSA